MAEKVSAPKLRTYRANGRKIVCLTAYDATFGALADAAGVDVILVGDSVGNTTLGHKTTVPVTLADMVHHTRAVRAGVKNALLVADLPFGTYEASVEQAHRSAVELMRAGAEAVKLEGDYPDTIRLLTKAGIPVMGHLGLTPQSIHKFGGFRVQGKGEAGDHIVQEAISIAEAGAIAIVLELVPGPLASRITTDVDCPTIGIGAGIGCDGQVQVLHDVLGLMGGQLKHAKQYLDGSALIQDALRTYADEVRNQSFPTEANTF